MTEQTTLPIDVAEPDAPAPALTSPADRAALALNSTKTERDLLALATKHASITEIKDKAGREQAHGAAMELMRARTLIEKISKETRDDATKFSKAVIAEENRLVSIISNEEKRLKALRDAWDAEQERFKREAEERERQRVAALRARIQAIGDLGRLASECRGSDAVQRLLEKLQATDMTGFEEFEAEAVKVHAETVQRVQGVFNAKVASEAEAARIKAEREELERQQVAQRAEAERLAAERAEIERMRAEIEAAKAPPAKPVEPFVVDGTVVPTKKVIEALASTGHTLADVDLVDTAPATEGAEIRMGFDMAMSMPVITHDINKTPSDAPPATSLIKCIAFEYGVDLETACQWLCQRAADFEAWTQPAAETV